jgi:hypothetical protein
MQVLVLAVQNGAEYRDLGAATSGATFFRSIGGSFGVAVFGAIFASQLTSNLARYLPPGALPGNATVAAGPSRESLGKLPPEILGDVVHAYARSIHTVFLWAVPVAALAFLLTFLLPAVPLRSTSRATDPGAPPSGRDSWAELERALTLLVHRQDAVKVYGWLAERAGVPVGAGACWLLCWLGRNPAPAPADLPRREGIGAGLVTQWLGELRDAGLARIGTSVTLTPDGRDALDRLAQARCEGLERLLDGWQPDLHPDLHERLVKLARELLGTEPGREVRAG